MKKMAEVAKECGFKNGAELALFANLTTQALRNMQRDNYPRFCAVVRASILKKVGSVL